MMKNIFKNLLKRSISINITFGGLKYLNNLKSFYYLYSSCGCHFLFISFISIELSFGKCEEREYSTQKEHKETIIGFNCGKFQYVVMGRRLIFGHIFQDIKKVVKRPKSHRK